MKNLTILLLLGFFITNVGYAKTTTLMCGGKYIGYDDQFIYLNWNKDKKIFKDKIFIRDKKDNSIIATLATSDTIRLYYKKKYLSYSLYGKERIVYLCKVDEMKK